MKKAQRQPLVVESALALALGVSMSLFHIAATPAPPIAAIEPRVERRSPEMSAAEKEKLRNDIKRAMAALAKINAFLDTACVAIMRDEVPREVIEDEPFTQVAITLREIESVMKDKWSVFAAVPIIGPEMMALRKPLALARSRAVQSSILIQQKKTYPTLMESNTDVSGLGELADLSTARLLQLVS